MNKNTSKILLLVILPTVVGIASIWGLLLQVANANIFIALLDAVISVGILAVVSVVLSNIFKYYRPSSGMQWMPVTWILGMSVIWLAISWALVKVFIQNDIAYQTILNSTIWLRLFLAILILSCVSLITWVRRQTESETKIKDRYYETQKLARDAELNGLRQQLQPHFLFNSLNSIYALIGTEPAKAREMIQQLSDFLRGTLRRDPAQIVSVSDELMHTQIYLDIEKVRFSERLIVNWNVDPQCENLQMPVLLLQPAVENAIKFGLYDVVDKVTIDISVTMENSMLKMEISNPFDANTASSSKGTGFGLESIQRRLYLLFGRTDLMKKHTKESQFILSILIPQNI